MKKLMGLIYKDVIQMKSSLIINFILDLLFIIVSIFSLISFKAGVPEDIDINSITYAFSVTSDAVSFAIVVIITPYTLVLNSVGIDEKSDFTRFILSSGCNRKTIVDEKTLFGLFASIPGIIFMIIISILLMTTGNPYLDFAFTFGLMLYGILSTLFLNSLAILYSSIFSSISNQAVGVIIFMLIGGVLFGGLFLGSNFVGTNNALYFFYGVSGALIALIVASYFGAIQIYKHKDF